MNFAPAQQRLQKLQWRAAIVAVVAGALCLIGASVSSEQLWRSYLLGFLFWWEIGLGCLGLTMLHHLVGGNWGYASRPLLTAGACTVPLLALMFLPLALQVETVYKWAQPEVMHGNHLLEHKLPYLNIEAFQQRAAVYFVIWVLAALIFCRRSISKANEDAPRSVNAAVCGLGLVILSLTVSFAAVDWSMSLEPEWYSSIYGGLIAVGGLLAAVAMVTCTVAGCQAAGSFDEERPLSVLNDLGSLMLAFIMLWSYFAFSQFLIIWSANLPVESFWYLRRLEGGWQWVALAILVFHFVVPFLLLLSSDRRRNATAMLRVACLVLGIHLINLFWHVAPAFHTEFVLHWLDLAAALAIGGVWMFVFSWQARRRLQLAAT